MEKITNKIEAAKILAGFSHLTECEYKGLKLKRSYYNCETISQGMKVINELLKSK